jgi:hypothetical protein
MGDMAFSHAGRRTGGEVALRPGAEQLHLALVVPVDSFDSQPQIIVAVHDQQPVEQAATAQGFDFGQKRVVIKPNPIGRSMASSLLPRQRVGFTPQSKCAISRGNNGVPRAWRNARRIPSWVP